MLSNSRLKHWLAPAAQGIAVLWLLMLAHAMHEAAAIADDNRQIV